MNIPKQTFIKDEQCSFRVPSLPYLFGIPLVFPLLISPKEPKKQILGGGSLILASQDGSSNGLKTCNCPPKSLSGLQDRPRQSKTRLRPAQHGSRPAQDGPRPAQDSPKRAQDPPKTAQDVPKTAQELPKTAQELPQTAQDPPKTRPGPDFILDKHSNVFLGFYCQRQLKTGPRPA